MDNITGVFIRATKTTLANICNKCAITDHVCNENHVNIKVIDRESDKTEELKREAIWIRNTHNMSQDGVNYQLSHVKYWQLPMEVSLDEGLNVDDVIFWLY